MIAAGVTYLLILIQFDGIIRYAELKMWTKLNENRVANE